MWTIATDGSLINLDFFSSVAIWQSEGEAKYQKYQLSAFDMSRASVPLAGTETLEEIQAIQNRLAECLSAGRQVCDLRPPSKTDESPLMMQGSTRMMNFDEE
jgi:hypothetical protein